MTTKCKKGWRAFNGWKRTPSHVPEFLNELIKQRQWRATRSHFRTHIFTCMCSHSRKHWVLIISKSVRELSDNLISHPHYATHRILVCMHYNCKTDFGKCAERVAHSSRPTVEQRLKYITINYCSTFYNLAQNKGDAMPESRIESTKQRCVRMIPW